MTFKPPRARALILLDSGAVAYSAALAAYDGTEGGQGGTPTPTPTPAPTFSALPSINSIPHVGQQLSAVSVTDGVVSNGSISTRSFLLAGSAVASSYVLQAADVGKQLVYRNGATGSGGNASGDSAPVEVEAAAAAYDVLLMPTCSFGVGIGEREAQDVDWPNVYNWQTRNGQGVVAGNTHLDQAIASDGKDYLSPAEYIGKRWAEITGRKVLLVPHSWNGTALLSNGHLWQPGDPLHEDAITRTNAAIAASGGRIAAIFAWESGLANDDGNLAPAQAQVTKANAITVLQSVIADFRSRITGAANVPVVLAPLVPERIASFNSINNTGPQVLSDAIVEVARTGTKTFVIPIDAGYSDDRLHLNNAGVRRHGPRFADIVFDTVAPTIATPAAATAVDGSPVAIVLTADEFVTWSLTGADAAAFEINRTFGTGGANNLNSAIATYTLRLAGNANTNYATKSSYAVTVRARDGAGNVTPKAITVTVSQAYGVGDQGPVSASYAGGMTYATNVRYNPIIPGVQLKAGLNLIYFWHDGGGTIQSIAANGVAGTRFVASDNGSHGDVWGLIAAADGTYDLTVNTNGDMNNNQIMVVTLKGTKAAPLSTTFLTGAGRSPPVSSDSLTCPANGIIIGMGLQDASTTPTDGNTQLGSLSGVFFANSRTTTGSMGQNGNATYSQMSTLTFEKSA